MNIVIVSGVFYPVVHPRAFRATELAKEFTRLGHSVTEITCKEVDGFDYDEYSKTIGVKIINLSILKNSRVSEVAFHKQTLFHKIERFLIDYLFCGNLFRHSKEICKKLSLLDCWNNAEMVIVMSTPFQCHYGFYKFIRNKRKHFLTILDSGDPFYYSKQTRRAIWFKYIEKRIYKYCDYLTIPTENAIPLYSPIIAKEKIKIIPQGFNMRNLKMYSGEYSGQVKIAYAGVFYWDIRNPEFLFRYLDNCKSEYVFYLFMRYPDAQFEATLQKYSNFANRVKVTYNLPHDELLYELSKMDFLVNIENVSNTQMPSKLIDYGMTKRPIFSCKETTFSPEKLERFLNRDYAGAYIVPIENYDIEKIGRDFIALYNSSNETK